MISMDAFIVLQCLFDEPKNYREMAAKRGVLSVDNSLDELLRSGLVEQVGTDVAITKLSSTNCLVLPTASTVLLECTK